LVNDVLALI